MFAYFNDNILPFCDANLIVFQGFYSLLHVFPKHKLRLCFVLKKSLPIYLQPFLIHFCWEGFDFSVDKEVLSDEFMYFSHDC